MRQVVLRALASARVRANGTKLTDATNREAWNKLDCQAQLFEAYIADRLDGVPVERGRYTVINRITHPDAKWIGDYRVPYTLEPGPSFIASSPRVASVKATNRRRAKLPGYDKGNLQDVVRDELY